MATETFDSPYLTDIPADIETERLNVIGNGITNDMTNAGSVNIRGTSSTTQLRTYTNADTNPCVTLQTFSHDNQELTFDGYYLSPNWYSTHSGSNFQIRKVGNSLHFNASGSNTVGNTFLWTNAMRITPSGVCYFNTLPFVGTDNLGVQTSASNTVTSTGAIAHTFQLHLRKMGTSVTARLIDVSLTSNTTSTSSVSIPDIIPAGYIPLDSFSVFGTATYNGTVAMIRIDVNNNDITLRRVVNGISEPSTNGTFTSGVVFKCDPVQLTWITS